MSRGHALVIPKHHGEKLTDIPDDQLAEILPVVKKIVKATGAENYNVLQNNGRIAHQEVDHVSLYPGEKRLKVVKSRLRGDGRMWAKEMAEANEMIGSLPHDSKAKCRGRFDSRMATAEDRYG